MEATGWRTDAGSLAAFLVPGVVVPLVLLVLAFWQPTKRQVLRWGASCDVVITDANREQVRSHLARGRRWRSVAAFPFWWLMGIRVVHADFPSALASPYPALAAYVGGGLIAEATSGSTAAEGSLRRATLLARSVADYVPRWTRVLPWALIAFGSAATILGRDIDGATSTRRAAVVIALAVVLALVAELVGRYLVRRPQRGSDPDVSAAWTGVATATSMATGAWILVTLPFWLVGQGLGIGLLCCIVRQETWGYRRRHRQQVLVVASA